MVRGTLAVLAVVVVASVVAAATAAPGRRVTITANHAVAEDTVPVLLAGTVSSRRRGQVVMIEQDECGPAPWRPLRQVRTGDGGGWVSYATTDVGVRLRARWHAALSRVIRVSARPEIDLAPSGQRLHVLVRARVYFPGARVQLQAFRGGHWATTATARLARLGAAGQFAQSGADFTAPRGHGTYRVVLPSSSAGPCYLGAASAPLRI
jgi:hypothetical protein